MDFVGQFELLARAEQPDEVKVGELIMAMAAESIDHIRQLLARLTAGTSQITARQHLSLYCRALARCQQEGAESNEATLDVLFYSHLKIKVTRNKLGLHEKSMTS